MALDMCRREAYLARLAPCRFGSMLTMVTRTRQVGREGSARLIATVRSLGLLYVLESLHSSCLARSLLHSDYYPDSSVITISGIKACVCLSDFRCQEDAQQQRT